ncbi:MAG: glutamate--tRNA ligase [SAR202 cluster bacterium]|nr:glutamate--tRNA ligase [Chloroflexota bacterium]MQG50562.1 glutamate--tRNA ligase [SAR202 cluster bacterium]|tara:strand:+ start:1355 stop:2836 length:1482 start_codon:yes stop_codon:yes gene_type:complete
MTINKPRSRFAPSPTGEPHVGNMRTAIFTWLFCRHYGGEFILRIEDTDQARKQDGALESIITGLKWLGLDWDEGPEIGGSHGPYMQSERLELYQNAANLLINNDWAYKCYCTPEELTQMRLNQQKQKLPPQYDRRCRNANNSDKEAKNLPYVIRFKIPENINTIVVDDLIRGKVEFQNTLLDDFVLLKSDGYPTYHLANVVDDHEMEISHVLRAEEWLSSTPKHLLLYNAFGYTPPAFAHLPMILGSDKSKLSKRHGATSILEYQTNGYLPEAMLNFLVLLGWSLDDKTEIFSIENLIDVFTIDRIGKSPSIFNTEKLNWMNSQYIKTSSDNYITASIANELDVYCKSNKIKLETPITQDSVKTVLEILKERIKTINPEEIWPVCNFFFETPEPNEQQRLLLKSKASLPLEIYKEAITIINNIDDFTEHKIETSLRDLLEKHQCKPRDLFGTIRIAITGKEVSPPLFITFELLGKKRSIERMQNFMEYLSVAT